MLAVPLVLFFVPIAYAVKISCDCFDKCFGYRWGFLKGIFYLFIIFPLVLSLGATAGAIALAFGTVPIFII